MTSPKIEPVKIKEYTCKQSKYGDLVPKLPTRATISFSGKPVLISNLILDVYKNCFNRIYVFSPTINIDDNWQPVKRYIAKEIKPREDEKCILIIITQKIYKRMWSYSIK